MTDVRIILVGLVGVLAFAGDAAATAPPPDPAPIAVLSESANVAIAREVFTTEVAELDTNARPPERVARTADTIVLAEDFDERFGGMDATEVTCYGVTGETLWEGAMLVLIAINPMEVRYAPAIARRLVTVTVFAPRSTSLQRSPSASPRRIPVTTISRHSAAARSRSTWARKRCSWSALHARSRRFGT